MKKLDSKIKEKQKEIEKKPWGISSQLIWVGCTSQSQSRGLFLASVLTPNYPHFSTPAFPVAIVIVIKKHKSIRMSHNFYSTLQSIVK